MSESENPEREIRPQPARPEFAVSPLRQQPASTPSTTAFRLAVGAWAAVAAAMIGLAAVVGLDYHAVRDALALSVSEDSAGANSTAISDTVTVTLLGSGAVAVLLLVLAALGLSMAAARKSASGIVLLVVGLATIGAAIAFWSFMTDAGSISAGVLRWGPLVCAGMAAVATVAATQLRRR